MREAHVRLGRKEPGNPVGENLDALILYLRNSERVERHLQAGWRYNGSFEGNIGYSKIESGNGGEVSSRMIFWRWH